MPATLVTLPLHTGDETVDFLRRMASMVSGQNGDMLMRAAATIEGLAQRARSAEKLYRRQQEESSRNLHLREVAELAADRLTRDHDATRSRLGEANDLRAAERARFETERGEFEAERLRLLKLITEAEAHVAEVTAEFDELRDSVERLNETAISVPIEMLRLARTQFDVLSDGFARNGDVISRAISEIGGCAMDQALAGQSEGRA
jgi:hypothetical protein